MLHFHLKNDAEQESSLIIYLYLAVIINMHDRNLVAPCNWVTISSTVRVSYHINSLLFIKYN